MGDVLGLCVDPCGERSPGGGFRGHPCPLGPGWVRDRRASPAPGLAASGSGSGVGSPVAFGGPVPRAGGDVSVSLKERGAAGGEVPQTLGVGIGKRKRNPGRSGLRAPRPLSSRRPSGSVSGRGGRSRWPLPEGGSRRRGRAPSLGVPVPGPLRPGQSGRGSRSFMGSATRTPASPEPGSIRETQATSAPSRGRATPPPPRRRSPGPAPGSTRRRVAAGAPGGLVMSAEWGDEGTLSSAPLVGV